MFKKIAYNTSVNFAAKVLATGLGLAAVAIMTRYLGAEGFGGYVTIIAYTHFFGLLADMGMTLVTGQLLAKRQYDEETLLSNLFTFRAVSAALFLLPAPIIALFLPYAAPIKLGIFIATFSFFFISLNQILIGFYQKHLLMARASWSEIANRVVLLAALLVAIALDSGLQGVVIASTLAAAGQFAVNFALSRSLVRFHFSFDRAIWRMILTTCWPIAVTITFNIIYLKADTLILSFLESAEAVGLYGAAYRVIDIAIMLPFVLAGLMLPQLTRAWHAADEAAFRKLLQHSFDAMVIVAVPLAVGAQFVAEPLMTLVAGTEFRLSGPILQVLILASAAIYLGTVFSHAIIAIDKQKQTIWAYSLVAVTALAGYLYLIPRYSYFGAAAVTVYSEAAIALLIVGITYYYTRFVPSLALTAKTFLAAGGMALLLYYTAWPLWPSLIAATAVYGILLSLLARRHLTALIR